MNDDADGLPGNLQTTPSSSGRLHAWACWSRDHWFLIVAGMIWILPGLVSLADRYWRTEQGAHGPIILATGLWAVVHEYRRHRDVSQPGSTRLAAGWLALAALAYVFARLTGILSLECLAAYGGMIAIFYGFAGRVMLARLRFPLLYLLFLIPPPYLVVLALTQGLKLWIAGRSVDLVSMAGLEAADSGSSLFVDGYELLVEAACSGLNSLVSLLAIGLFYIYWQRRDHWRHAAVLAALIVPLAIMANLIRVVLLLLLVHAGGVKMLTTELHPAAGFLMFLIALGLLVLADVGLRAVEAQRRRIRPA